MHLCIFEKEGEDRKKLISTCLKELWLQPCLFLCSKVHSLHNRHNLFSSARGEWYSGIWILKLKWACVPPPLHIVTIWKHDWLISLLIPSSWLTPKQTIAISMRAGGFNNEVKCIVQHCGMQGFLFSLQRQTVLYFYPNWEKCSKTCSYLLSLNNGCSEAAHPSAFLLSRDTALCEGNLD